MEVALRKWIDLFLFYVTIIIIITSIVLYIMPHGRIAYFTGWRFLFVDKNGWENLHVVFGLLMVILTIWHTVINWRVLKRYLLQRQSIITFLFVLIILTGTILNIQPFKSVNDLKEIIKNSWSVSKKEVPIAHGELLSLKDFCRKLNIPLNDAI